MSNDYLQHHGIIGQKWGVRRFQPYPKGHKGGKEVGEAAKAKAKQTVDNAVTITKEEAQRIYESRKQKALKSGGPKEVLAFKGDLTNQQMQEAITRMDLERKLTSYANAGVKTMEQRIDEVMHSIKKTTDWVNIGSNAYNAFAKIYNASEQGAKKPLKLIGGGKQDKNSKK